MEPVSGETIVLPPEQASEERAQKVVAASRENYAIEWANRNDKTKPTKEQSEDGGEDELDFGAEPKALDA